LSSPWFNEGRKIPLPALQEELKHGITSPFNSVLKSKAGLRFSSIGVGVSGFKVVCKPPQWRAVRGEEMILRMGKGEEEEAKILEEGIRRDGRRGRRERERERERKGTGNECL
jgi:hypothetical protein